MSDDDCPDWLDKMVEALPDQMSDDTLAATVLVLVSGYRQDRRDALPLLISICRTYALSSGISMEALSEAFRTTADILLTIKDRGPRETRH